MPQTSPSVLVIRLDAIGDALTLTPLLAALRERTIPVDLVLTDANATVFTARAAREVFVAPFALRSSSRETLRAIERFGGSLRERRYTHVFVATEDPGGYRLARAIGAPVRCGFSNGWGKPLKSMWVRSMLTDVVTRSAGLDLRAPHECEVIFSLARQLLGETDPTRDLALLRPLVLDSEPPADQRVAVQATDKWERLGIAFDDVAEAVRLVAVDHDVRLIAARSESRYAQRLARASHAPVDFFDRLAPWKDAIASARAIIAPDSGALHIAGMVGTPTVAVFAPQRHFPLQTARWAPWAAPHVIVVASSPWPARVSAALGSLLTGAPL